MLELCFHFAATFFFRNDDEKALARQKHAEMVTSKEFFEDSAEKNRETFK